MSHHQKFPIRAVLITACIALAALLAYLWIGFGKGHLLAPLAPLALAAAALLDALLSLALRLTCGGEVTMK